MAKYDACVPTALTTASTLVVTTADALLYGVTLMAEATATAGSVVCRITNTTGTPVYALSTVISGGNVSDGPVFPIVCAGGIVAVCTGTAFNYVVLYAKL
jgi:hypothetical protein